jgi:hypothetical protein
VGEEDPQDLELARGEIDPCPGDVDLVASTIELEWSHDDPALGIACRAERVAERDAEASIELIDAERLVT